MAETIEVGGNILVALFLLFLRSASAIRMKFIALLKFLF